MKSPAQHTSTTQKAALWRERMAQHRASGETIAAYCQKHKLGQSTFSYWRHRLGEVGKAAKLVTGFVEVGSVKAVRPVTLTDARRITQAPSAQTPSGIEIHLQLGSGVVLRLRRP